MLLVNSSGFCVDKWLIKFVLCWVMVLIILVRIVFGVMLVDCRLMIFDLVNIVYILVMVCGFMLLVMVFSCLMLVLRVCEMIFRKWLVLVVYLLFIRKLLRLFLVFSWIILLFWLLILIIVWVFGVSRWVLRL